MILEFECVLLWLPSSEGGETRPSTDDSFIHDDLPVYHGAPMKITNV